MKKGKAIIYLRVSSREQQPELMRKSCLEFCNKHDLDVLDVVEEQASAFKPGVVRERWEYTKQQAKDKQAAIVLFRYDRAFRDRKLFVRFMREFYELHGLKVYSVTESWVCSLWDTIDQFPNIPEPFDAIITDIMKSLWRAIVEITGQQAEDDSRKKSQSIRNAIRRKENLPTTSYNGKRWGRRPLNNSLKAKAQELSKEGHSIRSIAKELKISTGSAHNLVKEGCS